MRGMSAVQAHDNIVSGSVLVTLGCCGSGGNAKQQEQQHNQQQLRTSLALVYQTEPCGHVLSCRLDSDDDDDDDDDHADRNGNGDANGGGLQRLRRRLQRRQAAHAHAHAHAPPAVVVHGRLPPSRVWHDGSVLAVVPQDLRYLDDHQFAVVTQRPEFVSAKRK